MGKYTKREITEQLALCVAEAVTIGYQISWINFIRLRKHFLENNFIVDKSQFIEVITSTNLSEVFFEFDLCFTDRVYNDNLLKQYVTQKALREVWDYIKTTLILIDDNKYDENSWQTMELGVIEFPKFFYPLVETEAYTLYGITDFSFIKRSDVIRKAYDELNEVLENEKV